MKNTLTAVRLASIDRSRMGRCRRAEESQLFYFPRRPQERVACRRLPAAATYLAGQCDPRAFRSAFAIATRPLLLLMPPTCGSAALRIEAPPVSGYGPRRQELPRVCFAATMRMHWTFQWACWGGQPIYSGKKTMTYNIISLI